MEETTTTTTKKQPLSLNQRYNHLLSASQSKPQPRDVNNSKLKAKDADVPHFSFSDIDSSPDVTNLSSEKKIDDRVSSLEDDVTDDDASQSSGIAVVEHPIEKPKKEKVKIEGRRRLCKLSSKNDDVDDHQKKEEGHHFFDISDYSSPPPGKDEGCGGNEIRGILDDLSSRLDFLSIEKKRNPKPVDLKAVPVGDDSVEEVKGKGVAQKVELKAVPVGDNSAEEVKGKGVAQKVELEDSEFGSVGSSFAGSVSDLSSSSSGVNGAVIEEKEVEVGRLSESYGDKYDEEVIENTYEGKSKTVSRKVKVEKEVEVGTSSVSLWNKYDEEVNENTYKGKSKTVSRKVKVEPVVSHRKPAYDFQDVSDEDDDDCVEVGHKNWTKRAERHAGSLLKKKSDSSGVEVLGDDDANEIVSGNDAAITFSDPRSTYKLPPKVGKMLYPHQREGLKWLWSLHCKGKGGILGDDMGLGKTMQISGFLAGLFNSRLIKRVMIVAPKTLMPHWIKELTAVGLSSKIKEYYGSCPKLRQYELQYVFQDKGILLTTYDIVRFNEKQLHGKGYYDEDCDEDCDDGPLWDYMILDEGHLIKNPSTQRAKSLLGIPCAHRIIISGTPIQNNLKELWALFNFCCPDLLGDNKEFRERYEHPILRGNDKRASERDKRVGSMVAKELRERIQPYFLRRLKSEVFNEDDSSTKLSKKNEIIVWLRLTSCQRQLYEAFLRSEIVLSAFDGSPLAAITILKKICDHPSLLTKRAAEDVLEGMDSMLKRAAEDVLVE